MSDLFEVGQKWEVMSTEITGIFPEGQTITVNKVVSSDIAHCDPGYGIEKDMVDSGGLRLLARPISGKIIIMNAPPNSGKDVIAKVIAQKTGLAHMEFKAKLFELALAMSGLTQDEWDLIYTRELKETPDDRLWGMSPRGFLIHISEDMMKPHFGKDYFGLAAANAVEDGAVFSDGGFNEETDVIVDFFGPENVYVVQMTREGCSFEGDSRGYVDTDKVVNYLALDNNGTIEEAADKIIEWVNGETTGE